MKSIPVTVRLYYWFLVIWRHGDHSGGQEQNLNEFPSAGKPAIPLPSQSNKLPEILSSLEIKDVSGKQKRVTVLITWKNNFGVP